MIYKSYMYSLMDFHKLNILCIQHRDQKGGYSQHPSDLCAELRSRAQASHYGAGGGVSTSFLKPHTRLPWGVLSLCTSQPLLAVKGPRQGFRVS